ncbi:hypothetical protein GOODEAATRI_002831 [Goodea atripinnis]|uniref:Uncharacterized protein n=1 Tax=Goodea atripinnis TaxID=208336 RepID=A0ABV0PAY2_9TELE
MHHNISAHNETKKWSERGRRGCLLGDEVGGKVRHVTLTDNNIRKLLINNKLLSERETFKSAASLRGLKSEMVDFAKTFHDLGCFHILSRCNHKLQCIFQGLYMVDQHDAVPKLVHIYALLGVALFHKVLRKYIAVFGCNVDKFKTILGIN